MSEKSEQGWKKIRWAGGRMPLHAEIRNKFEQERPFAGQRIGAALHLEAKTANLILTLCAGGAELFVIGSNPLSTQDEVVAALAEVAGIHVSARRGETAEEHAENIDRLIKVSPTLLAEDGGDVAWRLHASGPRAAPELIGIAEETTTGVERLDELERTGKLRVPAFAVNNAQMKHMFDNRYGTGQSVWDAIMRSTNLLVAGKTALIVGYGWCGRGLAIRAAGLGARVLVSEINPVKAVEAAMDGFSPVALQAGMRVADFVITATGREGVVNEGALGEAKDGQILANAGHFGYEIDRQALERLAREHHEARPGVEAYEFPDGRTVYLLGQGELVNLALGDGHPVEIMDISFALQALTLEYLTKKGQDLAPAVYPVPREIDEQVARMVLALVRPEP